ncbi:MAG: hypothetical protein ABSB70_04415 [Candidatus Velthaea sp.]|jgi:hypothetical protein
MSKRAGIVRRREGTSAAPPAQQAAESPTVMGGLTDAGAIGEIVLPRDHPKWVRDRFVVSSATKALLARMKPYAIRLLGYWDHRVHRLEIEHGTVQIDDSGAYRFG